MKILDLKEKKSESAAILKYFETRVVYIVKHLECTTIHAFWVGQDYTLTEKLDKDKSRRSSYWWLMRTFHSYPKNYQNSTLILTKERLNRYKPTVRQ